MAEICEIIKERLLTLILDGLKSGKFLLKVKNDATVDARADMFTIDVVAAMPRPLSAYSAWGFVVAHSTLMGIPEPQAVG